MLFLANSYSLYCRICGKALQIEAHRAQGIGPICARKFVDDWSGDTHEDAANEIEGQYCDIEANPHSHGIFCHLEKGDRHFNIIQRVAIHSPTGMSWGYGGSGPADFAFNILMLYRGEAVAKVLYQMFKWEFVAKLPKEGGHIPANDIRKWLDEKLSSPETKQLIEATIESDKLFTENVNDLIYEDAPNGVERAS